MSLESPSGTPESRAEQYQQEAREIAERISQRWTELRGALEKQPHLLAGDPKLQEIDSMITANRGFLDLFEEKVKWIESHSRDSDALSRMTYRYKEDLEWIEKSLNRALG